MDIGIPKETRLREHRVALAPSGRADPGPEGAPGVGGVRRRPRRRAPQPGLPGGGGAHRLQPARGLRAGGARRHRSTLPTPQEYEHLQKEQVVFGFWGLPAMRPEDFRALAEQRGHGGRDRGDRGRRRATPRCARRCPRSPAASPVVMGSALLLNDFGGKGILLERSPRRARGQLRRPRGGRPRACGGAGRAGPGRPGDAARRERRAPARGGGAPALDGDHHARDAAEHREGALLRRPRPRARWPSGSSGPPSW